MSRTRSALLGSLSSQLFMGTTMLLTIVTTPFILRYLNKEEYGLYLILFQVVSYLSMFDFGLGSAIGRYLAIYRGNDDETKFAINKIVSTGFFIFTLLGVIICITGVGLSAFVPDLFKMLPRLEDVATGIVFTLSIFIGIQFPIRVFSSIFYAHQKQLLSNTTAFIIGLLNQLLPLSFLYFNFGLWSFVYTNIISSLISILITVLLLKKYYPYIRIRISFFDKVLLREMFGFGFFIFINSVAAQIIFTTDRFLTGALVSLSVVTTFSLTVRIPEICRDLIFKITDSTFPAMVEINAKEGSTKFKYIHQKLLLITTCFSMICFWMILIFNSGFIQLWVGEGYFAGFTILSLALMLMTQHVVLHVSAVCLNGAGIVKGFSIVSVAEAIINLGLSIWLGRLFGVSGILLATIIAGVLTSMWYTPYAAIKFMNIKVSEYFIKPILIPILVISLIGGFLYFLNGFILNAISLTWLSFFFNAALNFALLLSFTWTFILKNELEGFVPLRFKKYLLLK